MQQVIAQLNFGYVYYHIVIYPEKKIKKWSEIDKKLITKYQIKKSKFQRSRLKAKGFSNFYFMRWENIAIIMHTDGQINTEINYDDKFNDFNNTPINLKISERITFRIKNNPSKQNKPSVFIEKNSYKNIKHTIYQIAKRGGKNEVIKQFKKLNGLPSYSGIHQQKTNLRKALVVFCRKQNIQIKKSELPIRTKLDIVEVFDKSIYLV